jgi:hypothetical protein
MASRKKEKEIHFHGSALEAIENKALVWVVFGEAAASGRFF